jgi:enterochelin esterase-like enzyme
VKKIVALTALAISLVVVPAAAATSERQLDTAFRSLALGGTLHFRVYLPAGYDDGSLRYPVIYFLHGLPASPNGYQGAGFVAQALGRPAIVVAPQGARQGESDPEYLDGGPGHRWETALAVELPRVVDSRFRTIADRNGRALIGLSAGGYGATLIGLHHLDEFAVVESWSGYFHPTDPSGTHTLELGSEAADLHASAHSYVSTLRGRFARTPTLFAFYVGRDDDRFRDENEELDRELRTAGVPHVFHVYPGGHGMALWARHAPAWLALALDHLARPR